MKRICFISLSAYGYFNTEKITGGGAQRQLYLISKSLTDQFDVHFIVGDYGQPKVEKRKGVTLHRSYAPSAGTERSNKLNKLIKLLSTMVRVDADLYITRGVPKKAIIIDLLSNILRAPWVYNVATDDFTTYPPSGLPEKVAPVYHKVVRDANRVIAQTDKQKKALKRNYDVTATVIPNGYPEPDNVKPHENREAFLWVGRADPKEKRPHIYLDIAEMVPNSTFRIAAIPGKNMEYTKKVEDRARNLSNVQYLGAVPPDEIHQYYRDAIAVINTSPAGKEGFPNTFVEAWRYNTPTIGLKVNPGRFVGIKNYEGFSDGDFNDLVDCVRSLAQDVERRRHMSRPMFEYFQSNLQISKVANSYAAELRGAMSS